MDKINYGLMLEKKLKMEAEYGGVTCIRVPEKFSGVYSGKPQQKKTEFDYCLGMGPLGAAFFDAKATGDTLWAFNSYVTRKEKVHQYTALHSAYLRGNIAGYIVWFYKQGIIGFLSVKEIERLIEAGEKGITSGHESFKSQRDDKPFLFKSLLSR